VVAVFSFSSELLAPSSVTVAPEGIVIVGVA